MGKRRVKQQNVSVFGLFKLAGRHKKMDDVFVNQECLSTRWIHSVKTNTNKLNHKRSSRAFYYVCFFMCLSHTFCLVFCFFNCIEQPVFKAPIFPTFSTNIVIVIFNRWLTLLTTSATPLQPMVCLSCHFCPCLLAATHKCKKMKEWDISVRASGLGNTVW